MESSNQKQKLFSNKNSFENIFVSSKRKPSLIETDRRKEFYNNILQNFLNNNTIKH